MNAHEVREATAVAHETGRLLMEASWNRWHPRTKRLVEIVRSGEIGKVERIKTCFTYDGLPDDNIRALPELGGGGLYDLGPYSVAAPIWLMNFAPTVITKAEVAWHHMGSDETVRIEFTIGGAEAEAITSMNVPSTLYFEVFGSDGAVVMGGNDAFNSHNLPSTMEIYGKHGKRVENFQACDPYQLMADEFAKKIRGVKNCWIMPLDQSQVFAEFFDSVFERISRR
jgi:predicted dehydrogenase